MKKEIMLIVFIYSMHIILGAEVYCSDIADDSIGFTNCSSYPSSYSGFSCYQLSVKNDYAEEQTCVDYPDNADVQRKYVKLTRGYTLESSSAFLQNSNYHDKDDIDFVSNIIMSPEKETYNKGETISLKTYTLTDSDKKVIQNKKNCFYHFYGKLEEYVYKNQKAYDFSSLNVNDKNICFYAEKFNDNSNLVDCGYAHVNIALKNKVLNLTTCYFTPENSLSNELLFLYSTLYGNLIDVYMEILQELNEEGILNEKKTNLRKLQENDDIQYEIIVENKKGKKVKYTQEKGSVQILEKGKEDDYSDDIKKTNPCYARYYSTLDIFIVLSLLTLLW